jgi:hypothetical protein
MYRVYYLNKFVKAFTTRDAASDYVYSKQNYADYEILDRSDEQ